MYKGREKRKYKRVSQPFTASFRIKSQKTLKGKALSGWDRTAVLNLGGGGLLFYCNKRIKTGSLLDLRINFLGDEPLIECVGKAVRVEKLGGADIFLIAVVFKKINEKTKRIIEKTVKDKSLITSKRVA